MSNNNDRKRSKAPPPPFSGNCIPFDFPVKRDDDIGEEISRRVAGVPMFQSSFEPLSHSAVPSKTADPIHLSPQPSTKALAPARKPLWDIRDVPTLPEFHPLERTAVFVASAQAQGVAERITAVLRERSIEATYDNAKAKARCVTAEGVDFRIRMYRGRGKFSHGIIVEVQRRFGSSINFHSDTMAILDAAEGKMPSVPPTSDALPLVSDSEDDFEPRSSSLTMVSKLLKHPGYDAHYLALQTLSSLTDPAKVGRGTALKVSKALLESEGEIGNKLTDIVCDSKHEDETFGLRLMAMSILANAFQATLGRVPLGLREQLRPTLLDELRKAKSNPRMALMAAKCVEQLIPGDHNINELHEVLEEALEVGRSRHLALMRQAELCIEKIVSTR